MFETLPPFFRKNLPYTFQKLASREHRHVWLPLNRDYKPLGYLGEEIVSYADFAHQALVFDRDPRKFQEI